MEKKSNFDAVTWVVIAAMCFAFAGPEIKLNMPSWIKFPGFPSVSVLDVSIPEPSNDMKRLVESHKITELVKDGKAPKKDATLLAQHFYLFGKVSAANETLIKTTADLRTANAVVGAALLGNANIKAGEDYPGLGKAIDEVIIESLGKEVKPLNSDDRAKAVKTFEAIAWACKQGA